MLTPDEIDELRDLDAEATPGPWEVWDGHLSIVAGPTKRNDSAVVGGHRRTVAEADCDDFDPSDEEIANAAFIAAARTAVPALLDEVERLRGALRCLHATVRGYECESFGHDVLEAAMDDARRVLGEAGKGRDDERM